MDLHTGRAGNRGADIRSDCFVGYTPADKGGRKISIVSKVGALYRDSILGLATAMLDYFNIGHCTLEIEDSGALEFVLAARIEAAIATVHHAVPAYLTGLLPENTAPGARERLRFSRLYLPGNTPKPFINAGIHQPHGLILDLEDSVAPERKPEARYLVRNALRSLHFYGAERMVRINQVPAGLDDLPFIAPHHVNLILVPKCESAAQVHQVNERIELLRQEHGFTYGIWLMPIIESAAGVIRAYEIATAAPNIVAMAIGLEDFTADIGVRRSEEGRESFVARSQLVLACRAAGIQPIDSVYSDVADSEGLARAVYESRALGFDGMGCIHPRQVRIIHEHFAPGEEEIARAKRIVLAFEDATRRGLGVVALGSKMIDPPVVKRAQTSIRSAIATGRLREDWREEEKV